MVAVMAAIYRKEGTKNLYCTFTASDGKKVHRSTGKQKRSDAMKVALELEELEKAQKATKSEIQHRVYGLLKKGC
jgi:hypothetical protein